MTPYDNSGVRRQDRLLDEPTATEILRHTEYGILSMIERRGDQPAAYGIPINYAWDGDRYIYFHCAPAGHKLPCVDRHSLASLALVGQTRVVPRQFTTEYQSVVVRGVLTRGLPVEERWAALELLLDKYAPEDKARGVKYTEKSFARTEVLRLEITTVSGKTKRMAP